jgi:hypothetical protein
MNRKRGDEGEEELKRDEMTIHSDCLDSLSLPYFSERKLQVQHCKRTNY